MKKSNKILSLITGSVLCTQILSVPMFAMKTTKINTVSYDTRSSDLNNQIHALATEIHNSRINSAENVDMFVFAEPVYSIISEYVDKFENILYNESYNEPRLINIQSRNINLSDLLLRMYISNILNKAPNRYEIHESVPNLKILVEILTRIRNVLAQN